MVELDSTAPSAMAQDLNTRPGGVYELSVSFSPRRGVADNRLGVSWNGQQVAILDASGVGSSNTKWQRFTYRVTATGTTTELRFADLSGADKLGGLIDDVKVIPLDSDGDGVPDGQDRCEQTRMPEPPPSEGLGMNRWALIDGDGTFDTRTPNDKAPKRTFTLQDTGGCSCTHWSRPRPTGGYACGRTDSSLRPAPSPRRSAMSGPASCGRCAARCTRHCRRSSCPRGTSCAPSSPARTTRAG